MVQSVNRQRLAQRSRAVRASASSRASLRCRRAMGWKIVAIETASAETIPRISCERSFASGATGTGCPFWQSQVQPPLLQCDS